MKKNLNNLKFGKLRELYNSEDIYYVYCPNCASDYLNIDPEFIASKVTNLRWSLLLEDGCCNFCGGEEVVVSRSDLDEEKL